MSKSIMPSNISDRLSEATSSLGATLKSCVKILLEYRTSTVKRQEHDGKPLIVLGNGPSLKENLTHDREVLRHSDTLAVNFFANSPEFPEIRPRYYVLADPHFFTAAGSDLNVASLIENINCTPHPMTLFIPAKFKRYAGIFNGSNVTVAYFNFFATEGFRWFENAAWRHGAGMPRPRNVLIPSLMLGLAMGYREIYVVGADHSWTKTLDVDHGNTVVSVQPHFYADNSEEHRRVSSVYAGVRLHEVLGSMAIAFRSYHSIARYAARIGATIYNSTPGSMIDAFPRRPLPAQRTEKKA